MRRVLVAAAVVVSTVAATTTTTTVAGAAGSGWSVVAAPSPRIALASGLAGVSCSELNACTAVGQFQNNAGTFSLAERWNGTAFSIQATPNPTSLSILNGVSCAAAKACTAVGQDSTGAQNGFTLAEHWDGTTWAIEPTPNPSGVTASQLSGVACSAADTCMAVGSFQNLDQHVVLAERWSGAVWSLQSLPTPPGAFNSFLKAVSCTAGDACTAVGYYSGSHGEDLPLVERWNGSSWSIQSIASPTNEGGKLFGVSCTATTNCTAVGQFLDQAGAQTFALAVRWNGTAWAMQPSPRPSGAADAFLTGGVSCSASAACSAVGAYFRFSSSEATLAQRWDGTAWTVQPTPNPGKLANTLSSVTCPSATTCLAVGTKFQGQGRSLALAERFVG